MRGFTSRSPSTRRKPAAYDKGLHDRIGRSYAARTFGVIAAALRREMFSALMRLWDSDNRSVRMKWMGEILRKPEVADELAADVARQWDQAIAPCTVADFPEEERRQMRQ